MEVLTRTVFSSDIDRDAIIEKSTTKSDSLWSLYPRLSSEFDECVELFTRLEKLKELSGVDAAGIPIKLVEITHADIWFKLLPICLWIRSRKTSHRISIGVCGPPGAGKTVFSEILKFSLNALFANSCCVLGFDAYHFPNSYLDSNSTEHEGKQVPLRQLKGQPFTFDIPLFLNDLKKLHNKDTCSFPVYDRKLHDPVSNALVIEPYHEYVIVEGMLLLYNELGYDKIKELLDVVIFVEEDMERCHKRLIDRKVSGGRDREDSKKHYERVDKPNIIRVNNTKENANLRVLFEDGKIVGCILQK